MKKCNKMHSVNYTSKSVTNSAGETDNKQEMLVQAGLKKLSGFFLMDSQKRC